MSADNILKKTIQYLTQDEWHGVVTSVSGPDRLWGEENWSHRDSFSHGIVLIVVCLQVVIPFFSLFVKDLYFLNEGCTNRQADGNVNFEVAVEPFLSAITVNKPELSEFSAIFLSPSSSLLPSSKPRPVFR